MPFESDHAHHGMYQGQMGERLREVSDLPPALRVDLLRVQLKRAGEGQQLLAERARPLRRADLAERIHQPERADRERALLALEAVVGLLHAVAQREPVLSELV